MTRTRRQHGAAMTETVLVLPLIFVVLVLLLFFGLNLQRLQRVTVSSGYEASRQLDDPPTNPDAELDAERRLNEAMFGGGAAAMDIQITRGRTRVAEELLVREAGAVSDDARDWMEHLLATAPGTRGVGVEATFDPPAPILAAFAGPIRHHHVILDGDWRFMPWIHRRPQVMVGRDIVWPELHAVFYVDLGDLYDPLIRRGNRAAEAIWEQHVAVPGYRGPGSEAYWGNFR